MKRPGPPITKADLDTEKTYELIKDAQAGNLRANEILLRSFEYFIKKESLLHRIGKTLESEATGAGMRAFNKAIMTFKFDGKAKFATYASTCIYNGVQDENRIQKVIGENEMTDSITDEEGAEISIFDIMPSDSLDPEAMAERKQMIKLFWEILGEYFSGDEVEIIKLYIYEFKIPEIEKETNKKQKEINAILRKYKSLIPTIKENLSK